jgi:isoleucyl-tRNA synthetase
VFLIKGVEMNYKNTLNLPSTDFSMKANLISLEPRILSYWNDLKIYHRLREEKKGKEKFILHDGPPYANGLIHIGHVLNKILKDIVLKYKFMEGYDCPFIVGWDCHGLPVEHQLLKELNLTKHDIRVSEFRKKAKEFALKYVELQKEDFKRLGIFSDWDNPYLTLEPEYEYAVVKLLGFLVEEGYIYRARKPVNWCPECETALAEAEVEYQLRCSPSIYVKFKVKNEELKGVKKRVAADTELQLPAGQRYKFSGNIYFIIWTTTPWTLIANVAIAVHPSERYIGLMGANGDVCIIAEKLKHHFLKVIGRDDKDFDYIWPLLGRDLEGSVYKHPLGLREGKVVCADYVSMEEGTGCVHIAPGHGQEDYLTGKQYNLEIVMPVDEKGKFDVSAGELTGMYVHHADKVIIEKLNSQGAILYAGEVEHSYPHCWRCKKPIIFRATFQWFLNIDHKNLRQKVLKEVEKVTWVPPAGKERMKAMVVQRPDWCLSRQRLWGVPIPAVKCKNCREVILDKRIIEKAACVFREKGSNSWFTLDIEEFIPQEFSCSNCGKQSTSGNNIFVQEYDILDVWFESGASFFAVVKKYEDLHFPADMYLEGSDQHRGWFQVSLIPSVAAENTSPFKTILTHGFVVDGEGRKMSKSLGNVISPHQIIERYGAEILRLWVAYSDYSEDVKISEEIISQLIDLYRKIRNTLRFIIGNLYDFDYQKDCPHYKDLWEVDRYILSKLMVLFKEVADFYKNFSFYKIAHRIFNFCNLDLSSFYLDILKDRLYTFSPNSQERRSAQFVLYNIFNVIIRLIAPIFSFTAEEAFLCYRSSFSKKDSIFLSSLKEAFFPQWIDSKLMERWNKILSLRDKVLKEIEKKREEGIIGSSLGAEVSLELGDSDYEFFFPYKDTLREIFIVSGVNIVKGKGHITIEKAKGEKCLRCWNWRDDVKDYQQFPQVCGRCREVLANK